MYPRTLHTVLKARKCKPVGTIAGKRARSRQGATRTKCASGGDDGAMMVAAVVVTARPDENNK